MPEAQMQEEQTAVPEVVVKARSMGWVPKEEFRGDHARWVDADVFVEKGETMVPLLRHANKELENRLARTTGEVTELRQLVAASRESIEALQQFHEEDTQRQIKKAKADLLTEIKQAKSDGNVELEVQLIDELTEFNAATKAASTPAAKREAEKKIETATKPDPAFEEFVAQNEWFGKDIRRSDKAMGIAQLLRSNPENDGLTGAKFFQKVIAELELMESGGRPVSKVATSNPSSGGSGSGGNGKGYGDMPSEAKDMCTKQAKKLVGPGRAFADLATWQKYYAEQYFKGE